MDLKETTLENPQFGNGDVIRFLLEAVDVFDQDGNPIELDGIANDLLTPLSKLTRWLGAFGLTSEPGEEIDMEQAIGREAMAVIINVPGKDGTGAFARISDIVPLPMTGSRNGRVAAPPRPAPPKPVPDGSSPDPDFTGFWTQVKVMGKTQADVLALLPEPDLRLMADLDAAGLVEILGKLSA